MNAAGTFLSEDHAYIVSVTCSGEGSPTITGWRNTMDDAVVLLVDSLNKYDSDAGWIYQLRDGGYLTVEWATPKHGRPSTTSTTQENPTGVAESGSE